ncbi:hypothetical protein [Leptospira noguchii]|uniref:hypothetical protein n=1 Tax=Leptospira noguchii TaxID=28182 RepID=UPI0007741A0F|nr:hypothetical protein [Leptospira noguchii]
MKIKTIEFSHGPVSIYAHSFESENITMHVKEYLNTIERFRSFTHELTPGLGRVTICSTDSSVVPFEFSTSTFGTLLINFTDGRFSIDQDVIISSLRSPDKKIAINRLIIAIQKLARLIKQPEFVSA